MGVGSPLSLGMAGCLSSPHGALFQGYHEDGSHPLWFDCRRDQMSCCFLRDPNSHLQKQTQTAEGGEPWLWVSATAQQMLFPNLYLTNGLGCKNPGKDLAAELLLVAPSSHGSQNEGAELQVPPSWCARGAGPTGRSEARCAHTLLCIHTKPAALVTGKAFWEQLTRHHSRKTISQWSCCPSWQISALPHADPAYDKPLQKPFHDNPDIASAMEVFRTSLSRKSQHLQSWRIFSFREMLLI